jgi:hypothetical protein
VEINQENGQLEADLTACLAKLQFENNEPANTEVVIDDVINIMKIFVIDDFKSNGPNYYFGSTVSAVFCAIRNKFPNEDSFCRFVFKVDDLMQKQYIRYWEGNADTETTEDSSKLDPSNDLLADVIRHCGHCISGIGYRLEYQPMRDIENAIDSIDDNLPLEERYQLVTKLRSDLESITASGKLFLLDRSGEEKQIFPQDVKNLSDHDILSFHYSDSATNCGSFLERVMGKIVAIETEKELMDEIGCIDKAELNKNRLRFGAKGANLLMISRLLSKFITGKFGLIVYGISIPTFELIDTNTYQSWKNQCDISEKLRTVYESFCGKPIMIRSSAVYSEDGENLTGAGIYLSVPLEQGATFEQFCEAVENVYASCEADGARMYRQENGIERELMGLVVQERIEDPMLGCIDSSRPYSAHTSSLKSYGLRQRYIFDSKKLDHCIFTNNTFYVFKNASWLSLEFEDGQLYYSEIIAFGRILEKLYGQPVQIEFSENPVSDYHHDMCLLQVRPLPLKMFGVPKIKFPADIEHIYECWAEGTCDEVLDVLEFDQKNTDKNGLVVFNSSWEGSINYYSLRAAMPKQGAVMILVPSTPDRGHIETLALEKGLTILFHREEMPEDYSDDSPVKQTTDYLRKDIRNLFDEPYVRLMGLCGSFAGHKKVRIVANGKVARIYPVDEKADSVEES